MSETNRLRSWRKGCGLSLPQAERLSGVGRSVLDDMESGRIPLEDDVLETLAKIYGCSVAWLRGETAELSADQTALLNTIDHTSDRATVRELMEMLATRDPGAPVPPPANERLALIAKQMAKPGLSSQPVSSKRRYVKSQGQTRDHHCHWPGCNAQVPPAMWGCKPHWFKLPKVLRDRIWATYAPGQEVDMTPSAEYLQVADDVQRWIREHGDRP